ncbi:MAG: hypothetical protein WCI74_13065, partial [Actinomycetes bacterium]
MKKFVRLMVGGGVLLVAAAMSLPAVSPAVSSPTTYQIRIANSTGVDPSHVFVTLTSGALAPTWPTGLSGDTAYPLAAAAGGTTPWASEGGNAYSVSLSGQWTSGTILYSIGAAGDPFSGYTGQPTVGVNDHQYDYSELTFDATSTFNGDISAVNQIGIPARLTILKPDGTVAPRNGGTSPATEYVGCVDATKRVLENSLEGWDPSVSGVWRSKPGGGFLQLEGLGAANIYPQYPSFQQYVQSLAGKNLTVRGYYAGSSGAGDNPAYYNYSGTVATDGSVFLTGALSDAANGTGTSSYSTPEGIYLPGGEIWGHNGSVWLEGTGFGAYAQNGPYTVSGSADATLASGVWTGSATVPPASAGDFISDVQPGWVYGEAGTYSSIGNDIYGHIYGDLVVSYAMGYWGSDVSGTPLFNSSAWNTNPPATADPNVSPWNTWWTAGGLPAYQNAWAQSASYARYNLYQNATQTTGTTYGMALGDRFAPTGTQNPEMGVSNAAGGGSYGTWQVELLASNGCSTPTGISSAAGPVAGGQQLSITGRNIYPGASVTFGGVG